MKVFISYSVDDRKLVHRVAAEIKPLADTYYWNQNQEPGEEAWESIFSWIDSSDCVIAIITDKVIKRGESVNQEIGYAKGRGKMVIPMVGSKINRSRLGCLNGITHIPVEKGKEAESLQVIKQRVETLALSKSNQNGLVIFGLACLVLWVLGREQ